MTPRLASPPPIFTARFEHEGTPVTVGVRGETVTIEKHRENGHPSDIVVLPAYLWRCVAAFVENVRKTEDP